MPENAPGYDINKRYEDEFFIRPFLTNDELDRKARKLLPPLDTPEPFRSQGDRSRDIINAQIAAGLRPAALTDSFGNPLSGIRLQKALTGAALGAINPAYSFNGVAKARPLAPPTSAPAPPEPLPLLEAGGDRDIQLGLRDATLGLTDAELAELANLYQSGRYAPTGDALLGTLEALQKATSQRRIALIWDPTAKKYVYVSGTLATLIGASQGISLESQQITGGRPGFELPGVPELPSGFVDVPGETPVLLPGRAIIAGILNPGGGEQPTLPVDPPKKILPPLPDKSDKGNLVQPGGFLDLLFRRNPADP